MVGLTKLGFAMTTLMGLSAVTAQDSRLSPDDSLDTVLVKAAAVRPTPRQIAWQRDEISAFVHFGMNTFTDREWGDGTEDPKLFSPTNLDLRQWVRAAKAGGMTRMILTAKHHDGFCLWPSRYTEHCVRNSPWKDGKGDVVGEFVEACRAEGMHYGIYISPWDRHEKTYGDSPRYNQYFLNQLREVLTTYPGIEEVWFDGACAEGPNGKRQEYDWRAYWKLIRELVPNAAITVRGPDVRWCGNEAGYTRKSEWSVIPMPGDGQPWETSDTTISGFLRDIYGDDLGSRDVLMRSRQDRPVLIWYPSQVNTSIRPGWFYHTSEDDRVRSLDDLLTVYYGSVGGNGQFLLNIPPDRRGLFHENDVARLKQFGDVLRVTFSRDLAADAKLTAEVAGGESAADVAAVLDGNPDTFWTTTDGPTSAMVTAELPAPVRANCLMLQEHIASGQRVEAFDVEVFTEGQWRAAASGTVIGCKRLVRFADATVSKVRIRLTQFRLRPTLAGMGLYFAPAIVSAPKVVRDAAGAVTIDVPPGTCVRYTLDGTDPTEHSPPYSDPLPLPAGGLVNARTFALTPGTDIAGAGAAITRVEFGLAKANWKILHCSSQNSDGESAARAIDDNPRTIWHTRYNGGTDPMPHHIAVDMGQTVLVRGFTYTPRQDPSDGGIIMRARFEVSQDAATWQIVADSADFDNIINSRQQQVVRLAKPVEARYFRMTALRTANDNNLASAADISVLAGQPSRPIYVDVNRVRGPLNRAFRFCVGSDRAIIHLRPEHQRDLRFLKQTCGFAYMRFHGLLNEEMQIVRQSPSGQISYDWTNVDRVYDLLVRDLKMRPVVELGFMPEPLASGSQTIFWWKGNVTAPTSYEQWAAFIEALTRHFTDRYGADEVRHWYFEVWNEPNLDGFWPAGEAEYYKLYECSVRAIRKVDPTYRVGGPATAGFAWIKQMLDYCAAHDVPVDFVATHSYGAMEGFLDEHGRGKTMLAPSPLSVVDGLPDVLGAIRASRWPELLVQVTEWGPSYSARDPSHDSYFCAAWILHRLRRLPAGVQSMSYWTFSDQFEESGLPDKPFHGGFGLLNWQGLPKPAYFAYRFLNQLGGTELACADENVWACRDERGGVQVLLWDYSHPQQDAPNAQFFARDWPAKPAGTARLNVAGLAAGEHRVNITRVGYRHNDVYTAYLDLGSPAGLPGRPWLLSDDALAKLRIACAGTPETRKVTIAADRTLALELPLNENDVYFITIEP
jgi:alpha-L-fucosidase